LTQPSFKRALHQQGPVRMTPSPQPDAHAVVPLAFGFDHAIGVLHASGSVQGTAGEGVLFVERIRGIAHLHDLDVFATDEGRATEEQRHDPAQIHARSMPDTSPRD